MSTLKAFCKNNNMTYRQRRQGGRVYVTVAAKYWDKEDIRNWNFLYTNVVTRFYPDAYMTSGSSSGATYFVGDIVGMLKT
jgi:hypothetical protein